MTEPITEPTRPHPDHLALRAAAESVQSCNLHAAGVPLRDVAVHLDLVAAQGGGDLCGLLGVHTRQLDAMFSRALKEATDKGAFKTDLAHFALKAQKQCRNTIETASVLQGAAISAGQLRALREAARQLQTGMLRPRPAVPADPDPLGTVLDDIAERQEKQEKKNE